jgi:hypothetical protein
VSVAGSNSTVASITSVQTELQHWESPNGRSQEVREIAMVGLLVSAVTDFTDVNIMKRLNSGERFDGNRSEWAKFWDTFRTNVHENARLSLTDKFLILCDRFTFNAWSVIGYSLQPS